MTVTKRDSNFEWLRIISMLMIVAHHYVAKNIFNVDIEVVGNYAFVGNNLFFMISAYYLCDLDGTFHLKKIGKKVWKLEKQMLFYSIGLYIIFSIFYGGGIFSY